MTPTTETPTVELLNRREQLRAEIARRGGSCPWLVAELAAVSIEIIESTGHRVLTWAELTGYTPGAVDRCRRGV